jgi:hypothetical protein
VAVASMAGEVSASAEASLSTIVGSPDGVTSPHAAAPTRRADKTNANIEFRRDMVGSARDAE